MNDYTKDICLLTDYYQFTMAQAYFDHQRHNSEAVFHLFFRKNPFDNRFVLVAGIKDAVDFINNFHFSDEALNFLAQVTQENQRVFSDAFLQMLANHEAKIRVYGFQDGDVAFPYEPVLRIEGPLFLCQLLETPLLNIVNFASLIATKAARLCLAAKEKTIVDFGLRRAQGFDGAITATKAAYIGGIEATSNVWAAKNFGLALAGTQAHSFVMSYENQEEAFTDYCLSTPNKAVLLVDTYDVSRGIDDAIKVFLQLKDRGLKNLGLRIDSGDLSELAKLARRRLNQAGLHCCKIIASGDLDEFAIAKLESDEAPIDVYGVGTRLVTAYDEPALAGVFKLASITERGHTRDTYKSAHQDKLSFPGPQTVVRFLDDSGIYSHDRIFDPRVNFKPEISTRNHMLMHQEALRPGEEISTNQSLNEARAHAKKSLTQLPAYCRNIEERQKNYPVYFGHEPEAFTVPHSVLAKN